MAKVEKPTPIPESAVPAALAAKGGDEDEAGSDPDSSSEEDLLSGTGSGGNADAPPTVLDPKDMELSDEEDEPLVKRKPKLPEPVKQSIDENALDAKHNLKESLQKVATPSKAVSWTYLRLFTYCFVCSRFCTENHSFYSGFIFVRSIPWGCGVEAPRAAPTLDALCRYFQHHLY